MADKILAALSQKDSDSIALFKNDVEDGLGKAIRSRSRDDENDFGLLLGPLSLVSQDGNWTSAEQNLRDLIARSANAK
jgi:hypothetical protein